MKENEVMELLFAILIVVLLLSTGTLSYMNLEGWSATDSFYFSVSTLTTAGYGDLTPTNSFSRLFTAIYLLVGISMIFYSFSLIVSNFLKKQQPFVDKEMSYFLHKLKKNNEIKQSIDPPKKHNE